MTAQPSALTLSVVVCCYSTDRWRLLLDNVASLRAQSPAIDQLVVVVDHNDALLAQVRDAVPDATVVPNRHARGLSGARNSGIEVADGDIVAFVDDDVVVESDWAKYLLAPYSDSAVIGVGGRIVPRFEVEPRWLPPELDWVVGCTYSGHRSSMGPVRNLIGANMSFRREVFETAGNFRTDLGRSLANGAGCEETEFCIRAARDGGVMWYEPAAVVQHFVPRSRVERSYFRARCFGEGMSKAHISRIAGRQQGLASERKYARSTLPRAVMREIVAGLLVRRSGAWARVYALITAVFIIAAGYLRGLFVAPAVIVADQDFEPLLVGDLDVDTPTDLQHATSSRGRPYKRALLLARHHGAPTSIVELTLPDADAEEGAIDEVLDSLRAKAVSQPAQIAPRRRAPEDAPFVSVIIATRDRPEELRRALDSVLALRYDAFEVVVVDNASATGETAKVVASYMQRDERVRYIFEPRPGLAQAHNTGLQIALGSIVAFTDDDVVVDQRWVEAIVTAFGDDQRVACVTGMILPLEIETQSQEWIERAFGFGKGLVTKRFDLEDYKPHDPLFPFAAGTFGSGANMAFRAGPLREIGGFDPALGAGTLARGGDDLAAFFDLVVRGFALVYEPGAIVRHAHRRDYASLRRQSFDYGVGLGSYLAHVTWTNPRSLRRAVVKLPRALGHFVQPGSAKNARRPADFPRELVRRERAGVLVGPWRYAKSRRRVRHELQAPVAAEANVSGANERVGTQL
ncbi:MAG TPA: glycosyltransferase [Acidimicrobiia bacterium]|nr:glycosyltransferase [Acidimicrobiia bacterium]